MTSHEREWWIEIPASVLRDALDATMWTFAEGINASQKYQLRCRRPIPAESDTQDHPVRFSVLWSYGSGDIPPSPDEEIEMTNFERQLCQALEHNGLAFLVAVLTQGGSRHWVFYTSDGYACGARVAKMPGCEKQYPVEMIAANDPMWSFVRTGIFDNPTQW